MCGKIRIICRVKMQKKTIYSNSQILMSHIICLWQKIQHKILHSKEISRNFLLDFFWKITKKNVLIEEKNTKQFLFFYDSKIQINRIHITIQCEVYILRTYLPMNAPVGIHFGIWFGGRRDLGLGYRAGQP